MKRAIIVAPFTGAWIEIVPFKLSLKLCNVAPFTGAWIEICVAYRDMRVFSVAPFTGAWIEIEQLPDQYPGRICRSLHGSVD